jgi:hypothetical protein
MSASFQVLIFSDSSVILGLISWVLLASIGACYSLTISTHIHIESKRGKQRQEELTKVLVETAGNILSGRSAFTAIGLETFEGPRATIGGCIIGKVSIW